MPRRRTIQVRITRVESGRRSSARDTLAVEEPLEIHLAFEADGKRVSVPLAVTMRTPGNDYELAAGFLFTEGVVHSHEDIHQISYCVGSDKTQQEYNRLSVSLRPGVRVDAERLKRHFVANSSCGVCGKSSLEALCSVPVKSSAGESLAVHSENIRELPSRLNAAQSIFARTGGVHGAALFDADGSLLSAMEDVGRHNAVDKLIGAHFLANKLPLASKILLVSSRASFEIMQKAAMAQIPIVAAVGAPSSLAVELAEKYGITLIGFLRGEKFNVYAGSERVRE